MYVHSNRRSRTSKEQRRHPPDPAPGIPGGGGHLFGRGAGALADGVLELLVLSGDGGGEGAHLASEFVPLFLHLLHEGLDVLQEGGVGFAAGGVAAVDVVLRHVGDARCVAANES